jgi:hypothetical protein
MMAIDVFCDAVLLCNSANSRSPYPHAASEANSARSRGANRRADEGSATP